MGLNIGTWQWRKGNRSESRQSEGPDGVGGRGEGPHPHRGGLLSSSRMWLRDSRAERVVDACGF